MDLKYSYLGISPIPVTAASAPIRTFLELLLPLIRTAFFPSQWLVSYRASVRCERRINPVAFPGERFAKPGIEPATHLSSSLCTLPPELPRLGSMSEAVGVPMHN